MVASDNCSTTRVDVPANVGTNTGIDILLSIYGITSDYGKSYTRPLGILIGLTLANVIFHLENVFNEVLLQCLVFAQESLNYISHCGFSNHDSYSWRNILNSMTQKIYPTVVFVNNETAFVSLWFNLFQAVLVWQVISAVRRRFKR